MPAQHRNRLVFPATLACFSLFASLAGPPAFSRPAHAAAADVAGAAATAESADAEAVGRAAQPPARPGAARPQPGDVEEIVVVGRRLHAAPLAAQSAAVAVIGREEIERSGAVDLLDVLRGALGVAPNRSGGPGQQASLFVRGGNGERVQVIVDGVRVKDDISGNANWGLISAQNIERVEVLRGAQSTLFGADAAGGVVQIFTRAGRNGRGFSGRLGFGRGEHGACRAGRCWRSGSALLSGETRGLAYNAGISHRESGEISAYRRRGGALLPRGEGEHDAARNTQLQGRIALNAFGLRSALSARHSWIEADYDGGFPVDPGDARTRHDTRETQLSWQLDLPRFGNVESRALLAQRRLRRSDWPAGDRRVGLSRQASLVGEAGFGALQLLAGADFEALREELRSFTSLDARTSRAGLFARGDWQVGALGLDGGLRYERHSEAGSALTWQLGGRYALLPGLDVVASGGSAFRAPSPFQLFNAGSGNRALSPERSRSYDFGLRFSLEAGPGLQLRGEARGFRQRYRDMIDFVFTPPATASYFNVSRARYRGVELEARLRAGPLWLAAAHTRIQSRAQGSHTLRRPDTARLALGFARSAWEGEAVLHYTGARRDVGNVRLPAHTLLDLNWKLRIGKNAGLRAHLHNVTGRDYQEIDGYGTLGRTLRVFLDLQL